MTRRQFAIAAGSTAAITMGASSCSVSPISVLTSLIASASGVIAGLVQAGLVTPTVAPWVAAASKFLTDVATELVTTDLALTKIAKSLALFTSDFAGIQFPTEVGTFITVAILAINAIEAFLKAQQAPMITARITPSVFAIGATLSSKDRATLKAVVDTQKGLGL